jgi:hypothetical protein
LFLEVNITDEIWHIVEPSAPVEEPKKWVGKIKTTP